MIKYRLNFRAHDDSECKVEISKASYSGDPIAVKGVSNQCCSISYSGSTDDPFSTIISSSVKIALYNEGQVDINELQRASDKDFTVEVFKNSSLVWKGYLVADGVQRPFKSVPYNVELSAIDGLAMLEDLPYTHTNLPGLTSTPTRAMINYIRYILFSQYNLGIALPLRWSNSLVNSKYPSLNMFFSTLWSPTDGSGFYSEQDDAPSKSCAYILGGMLKACQAKLYQSKGKWVIRRVNDLASGAVAFTEIAANFSTMTPSTGTEDLNINIGSTGFPFINEDQLITISKGYRKSRVTYKANKPENIIPNGDFEIDYMGAPLNWSTRNGVATLSSETGITEGSTKSMKVENTSPTTDDFVDMKINTKNYLPINTKLFKVVDISFIFSPVAGFPFSIGSGLIDWSSSPFRMNINFNDGLNSWTLTDFGFFQKRPLVNGFAITVDQLKIGDVARVSFDKFKGIILPNIVNADSPNVGFYISFKVNKNQSYFLDDVKVTVQSNDEICEAEYTVLNNTSVYEKDLEISSSMNGFFVSNFMESWSTSEEDRTFIDGVYKTGDLTEITANAYMRQLYKPSLMYNGSMDVRGKDWSFDSVYSIETIAGSKFIATQAEYNLESCEVSLVAIECRNDSIALTERSYGSNDKASTN